jgi:hypothetical protein
MKYISFLTLFVGIQITGILMQLYKQSQFIKLSYRKQRIALELAHTIKEKQEILHTIAMVHDCTFVKKFAQEQLGLRPIALSQIKKVAHDLGI